MRTTFRFHLFVSSPPPYFTDCSLGNKNSILKSWFLGFFFFFKQDPTVRPAVGTHNCRHWWRQGGGPGWDFVCTKPQRPHGRDHQEAGANSWPPPTIPPPLPIKKIKRQPENNGISLTEEEFVQIEKKFTVKSLSGQVG